MGRTADELIDSWEDGDLSIDNADTIEDLDGHTIQAKFECEDGHVILTYSLQEELSYKPDPDGDGTVQFNLLDE